MVYHDLYLCLKCGRPLEATGRIFTERVTLYKTLKYRELECGHGVPVERRPIFKAPPGLVRRELPERSSSGSVSHMRKEQHR